MCSKSVGGGLCHCNSIFNTAVETEGASPALTSPLGQLCVNTFVWVGDIWSSVLTNLMEGAVCCHPWVPAQSNLTEAG